MRALLELTETNQPEFVCVYPLNSYLLSNDNLGQYYGAHLYFTEKF